MLQAEANKTSWADNGTPNQGWESFVYLTEGNSAVFTFAGIRFRLTKSTDGAPQNSLISVDNPNIRITVSVYQYGAQCALNFNGRIVCQENQLRARPSTTEDMLAYMVDAKTTNGNWGDGNTTIISWEEFAYEE
jgi:hypothetical protein